MLRRTFVTLLLAASAGCGDNGEEPPAQPPGIDLLPSATGISVTAGGSGTVSVAVKREGGYVGDVALTLATAPAGVTGVFAPATLPNGTTSSVLTLTVTPSVAAGTAPITVRATGPGIADKTATLQLTVLEAPPSTGSITWKFCDPVIRTIWLAVQDGPTGAWKQIIGASNTFKFDISQPKGAVAWTRELIADNYVTEVFYGTPDEIATFGAVDCLRYPTPTKMLTGTVTGFTPSNGISGDQVTIGTTGTSVLVGSGMTFQLFGVPEGPRDFIAARVSHTFANGTFNDTLTKVIIRRDVNATGSLDPFDFNSAEAVAPTTGDLIVNGTNGEPTILFMSYITDPTAPPALATRIYTESLGLATTAPLYLVPFPLQRDSDLHELSLFTGSAPNPGEPNVSGRRITKFFSAPQNQTLTLGPALAIPISTAVADSPPRYRVQAPVQAGYDNFYLAEWLQLPSFDPTRAVALIITAAYAGGSAWDATVPDLAPAGWSPAWGLRTGVETGTFFSGEGATFPTTVPSGARNGGTVTSASRTSLPTGTSASAARLAASLPLRP